MTDPMQGKKIKSREVLKWTGADSYMMEFYMPGPYGKEVKSMEINFHRKGSAVKDVKEGVKDAIKKETTDAIKKLPAALPVKK